jgi:hypothetical protein
MHIVRMQPKLTDTHRMVHRGMSEHHCDANTKRYNVNVETNTGYVILFEVLKK